MTFLERAKAIFERYIGYKVNVNTYTKTMKYDLDGALIRNDKVVEILSIRAKSANWVYQGYFGSTEWYDINLQDVVIHERNGYLYVNLPPTLFGTDYSEIEITYIAGHEQIPADMVDAVQEIERLLIEGTITEWNCILPVTVLDVIEKYRKEGID
jgi:hypothetical protein